MTDNAFDEIMDNLKHWTSDEIHSPSLLISLELFLSRIANLLLFTSIVFKLELNVDANFLPDFISLIFFEIFTEGKTNRIRFNSEDN